MDNRKVSDEQLSTVAAKLILEVFGLDRVLIKFETMEDKDTMYDNDLFCRIVMYYNNEHHAFSKFYRRKNIESMFLTMLGTLSSQGDDTGLSEAGKGAKDVLSKAIAFKGQIFRFNCIAGIDKALFTPTGESYIMSFLDEFIELIEQQDGE